MERKSKAIAQVLKVTSKKQEFGKDFQYVVKRRRKAPICFGSSQSREKLPQTSRLGVKYVGKPIEILYPGRYFTPHVFPTKRLTSTRGTVLGGRTAGREVLIADAESPAPNKYSLPKEIINVPSFKRTPRRQNICRELREVTAGPGYYTIAEKEKQIKFAHSFGGPKKLVSAIEMKCNPVNTDTCEKCKKFPTGDYWAFTPGITWKEAKEGLAVDSNQIYLCRDCYEKERRRPRLFEKGTIAMFKKVRGCSQIHFHDGCEARILLVPPRDIAKIKEKEAYLSLYFP